MTKPLVLIVSIRENWVQHMVATSIEHYYNGEAKIKAVTMTKTAEWGSLIPKAALVVPLYWLLARPLEAELKCPKQRMLISMRGVSGRPLARVPKLNQTVLKFSQRAAGVLCANEALAKEWRAANYPHVYIGHSAVDLRYWQPPSVPRPWRLPLVVGWTGNAQRPDKRVHTLFMPAVKLAGSCVQPLVQCGFTDFIPWEQMAERFYHKIDVLCITSTGEGTPNPCLEAMACGVPVLSTKVGHVPEVIRHGRCGWILSSQAEFAAKLRQLAADPKLLQTMSINAINRAKEWSWEKKILLWKHAIEHTLKRLRLL